MSDTERFDVLTDSAILGSDPTAPGPLTSSEPVVSGAAGGPSGSAPRPPESGATLPPALPPRSQPSVAPSAPAAASVPAAGWTPARRESARSPWVLGGRGRRRLGWLWIPGAAVLLGGLVAVALGVLSLVTTVDEVANGPAVSDGGSLRLNLEAGDERTFWVERGGGDPRCEVVDPAGVRTVVADGLSMTLNGDGRTFEAIGGYTATRSGLHSVGCVGGSVTVSEGSAIGGVLRGVGAILMGALALVGGIILTVGTLVGWRVLSRRR